MGTADEQIRVSERVKELLDQRRRADESYNDVLERVLDSEQQGDFYAGFGLLSENQAERIRTEKR